MCIVQTAGAWKYCLTYSCRVRFPNSQTSACESHDNTGFVCQSDSFHTSATVVSADAPAQSHAECEAESGDSRKNGAVATGDDATRPRAMRSMILILALSLHHLFEGISLGLQRTVPGVFTLLIALLSHETIISFSLGLQFVKSGYSRRQHYITSFVCSVVEPIGVAVGNVIRPVCTFAQKSVEPYNKQVKVKEKQNLVLGSFCI